MRLQQTRVGLGGEGGARPNCDGNLEAEAAYDEENGWTRYELDDPVPPVAAVAESINKDDKEAAINSMPLRRRGRPPINRGL
jgi:hypothetical protein